MHYWKILGLGCTFTFLWEPGQEPGEEFPEFSPRQPQNVQHLHQPFQQAALKSLTTPTPQKEPEIIWAMAANVLQGRRMMRFSNCLRSES